MFFTEPEKISYNVAAERQPISTKTREIVKGWFKYEYDIYHFIRQRFQKIVFALKHNHLSYHRHKKMSIEVFRTSRYDTAKKYVHAKYNITSICSTCFFMTEF